MRVLVIGANGLIGGYVTARLLADGCEVVGVGRDVVRAARRMPRVRWIGADIARMKTPDWAGPLSGVQAVVNCAGALQDGPRDDLRSVHLTGLITLARACEAAGVRRFIQISAAGLAAETGPFAATKLAAEAALAETGLDWVILRPALVLAPAAYGGSALLRGLAAFPGAIPAIHADAIVQTVSADDVAEAVARSLAPGAPARIACDLAAAEPTRLADILMALRAWLGLAPAPVIDLPPALGRVSAAIADALAWLGWRSPLRSAAMSQLPLACARAPTKRGAAWASRPATWRACSKAGPPACRSAGSRGCISSSPSYWRPWPPSGPSPGLVGLLEGSAAIEDLTRAGFAPTPAQAVVIVGAVADLAVAALICVRRTTALGLAGALSLSAVYLAGASLAVRPDLWSDPLGPLVKVVPAAVLALVALAILDER